MAGAEVAAGLGIGIILFMIFLYFLFFGLMIFAIIFWILMLINVIQRKFKNENDKVMWVLIVVLAGIIGALIYYFMIKKPNKH